MPRFPDPSPPPLRPDQGVVVLKIGSAILAPGGRLDSARLGTLAREVRGLRDAGLGACVVSSGAVACGLGPLGLERMPDRIDERQVAAAVGQPLLMRAWGDALGSLGLHTAQVLLTADDADGRGRFINARRTLESLLARGVVPIVNENDSVAFDEIKLGDNDRLSALAAHLSGAHHLIMLSKAPGVCRGGPGGEVIPVVECVAEARAHATDDRSATGIGGMRTKLDAAEAALAFGVEVTLLSGDRVIEGEPGQVLRAARGGPGGTRFPCAAGDRLAARKHWIAHATTVRGSVVVDDGARTALVERGASLLPKGVVGVECATGRGFTQGACVDVRTPAGPAFARGIVSYASGEIERIRGLDASEIAGVLGLATCDEVIHRDNMIVLDARGTGEGRRS